MLVLYIVRHGQTQYNIESRIQGWCDSPLSDLGKKQAEKIGKYLQDIDFKGCVCSDTSRTINTAKIILKDRNISITTNSNLRELHFGSYEAKKTCEMIKLDETILRKGFREFNGEDIQDLVDRYLKGLEDIKKTYQDGNILVVSHGRAITTVLKTLDPSIDNEDIILGKSKIVDNCSVSKLTYENHQWKVLEYNHTCK